MSTTPWLKVQDAACYTRVSSANIYTACERGELRHVAVVDDARFALERGQSAGS